MRTAMVSAHSLASFLMDRVARLAARSAVATWSTPGRPSSTCRSAASEISAPTAPASHCRCATVPVSYLPRLDATS